jgi:integrase
MARARFRDFDGVARPVTKWGDTKGSAERALKVALRDRKGSRGSDITTATTVGHLADLWLADIAGADLSTGTKETYTRTVQTHVVRALGGLRLREVGVPDVDRALKAIRAASGPSAAKTTKSVLSGMFKLAVRHGAVELNPVRDVTPIPTTRKPIRALTVNESEELINLLRADDRANMWDLPDLVEFMLGTGCRIGEACAVRDSVLDMVAGTVEINATVVRVHGQGLVVQERPKTAAGWRVLALPASVLDVIRVRDTKLLARPPQGVVFGSPAGALRDRSNTAADLRVALDGIGFGWVTSHVFRKTVATRLDEAGYTAREIADQLGHARPSLTQDLYMGRNVVSARAAHTLNRPEV